MEKVIGSWRIAIERLPMTTKQISLQYDYAAPGWNTSIHWLGYPKAYAQLFQQLKEDGVLLNLNGDSRVIDCGIGTGALSLALAHAVTPDVQIEGIDIAPQMLEEAQQRFWKAGISARFHCHDVQHLPYDDHTFDLAVSAHTLEHLPDPQRGLREMHRVLKPGAPMLILMTRRSLLGSLIQLKWNIHCIGRQTLLHWMHLNNLVSVHTYDVPGPPWCKYMSIACIGFKP